MRAAAHLLFFFLFTSITSTTSLPTSLHRREDVGSARRLIALDSDIAEVQERWRQYRNAVKDGFFFNETMIVVSDYESDDQEGSEELTTAINDNIPTSNVDNREIGSSTETSGVIAESEIALGANIEKNGLEKGGFETTLTGMMEALEDIQTKGDLMMGAIRGQRELLFDVRGEVRQAEERLVLLERERKEEEERRKNAEEQRLLAEARTRMVELERVELAQEVEEMEKERELGETRLQEVRHQVEAVLGEVEENGEEMFRLKEGLRPILTRLKTRKSQLNSLEVEVVEKKKVLEVVRRKIDTSEEILRNLETKLSEADKIVAGSSTSSLLLPIALFVSGLFNVATGGHIVSSLFSSKSSSKMDDEVVQYAPPPQLPSYYPDYSDHLDGRADVNEDQGVPGVEEQRFEDMYKQDVYYNLPRSLQSQYFETKEEFSNN